MCMGTAPWGSCGEGYIVEAVAACHGVACIDWGVMSNGFVGLRHLLHCVMLVSCTSLGTFTALSQGLFICKVVVEL